MTMHSKKIESLEKEIADLERVRRVTRSRVKYALAAEAEAADRREAYELLAAFRADGVKPGEAVATYQKLRQAQPETHHRKVLSPRVSRVESAPENVVSNNNSGDFPIGGIERGLSPVRTLSENRTLGARPV